MTGNGKDPLQAASRGARALFEDMSSKCTGHSVEDIISASGNLMINALRQAHANRDSAHTRLDEISANFKKLLDMHYDSFGRVKGVFPFTQTIEIPLFDARPKVK